MPIYNRAAFLPEALRAIREQTCAAWELIVVDDGSTDASEAELRRLTRDWPQSVRYVRQENAGPYAARNTGLDHARGQFVAFYDSDDLWLPQHLTDCLTVLHRHEGVAWVYAAARKVVLETGEVRCENHFHEQDRPHPLLALRCAPAGKARVLDDPDTVRTGLLHNLCCFLQTSVIRAEVFRGRRFEAHYRNEGEDELFPLRAIKAGFRLAYIPEVHLVYRAHAQNSSSSAQGVSTEKHLRITAAAARGYEELAHQIKLTPREEAARRVRLANEYFWKRGYVLLWSRGQAAQGLTEMRRGLRLTPYRLSLWRCYLLCRLRSLLRLTPSEPSR